MSFEETVEQKMQIFRAAQAPKLMEAGVMDRPDSDPTQRAGLNALVKAGYLEGDETKLLFNIPGFSLVQTWFKKDYPLLLHSHNADCLYYIIAGAIRLGTEDLGPGDGFFVPAGARYKYRPGPDGVELLEFRHATHFDIQNYSKGAAFYEQALQTVTSNLENWRNSKRPSER
jgi:mannose-6-phosphate isomerase-like protein (cupin superfamily)